MIRFSPLKYRSDFLRLNKDGQKWVTKGFVLLMQTPSPRGEGLRLGITATKKTIDKRAVIRNRARRRLREMARITLPICDLPASCDIVLIARPEALERPFAELQKDLKWALKRILGK